MVVNDVLCGIVLCIILLLGGVRVVRHNPLSPLVSNGQEDQYGMFDDSQNDHYMLKGKCATHSI